MGKHKIWIRAGSRRGVVMLGRLFGYGLIGSVITLLIIAVVALSQKPEIESWHSTELEWFFHEHSNEVEDFADYLELEDKLFEELEREIVMSEPSSMPELLERYRAGNWANPESWDQNWNRSFEWTQPQPRAGVLLLHGLSDSPYSLRHLGESLHRQGATVLGLRLPGHGTIPSGLAVTKWEDMEQAVHLAVRHLREELGEGVPIHLVGYSNGGALALMYALEAINDESLPRVDSLVLLSPEVSVTPAASLAIWQARLGRVSRQPKLGWNSIEMEIDPFKYRSFAINAGVQAHRITAGMNKRLSKYQAQGNLDQFPSVLAFQSLVDSTVSTEKLIERLFQRLPEQGHELVLFDLNRKAQIAQILSKDPGYDLKTLLTQGKRSFRLGVVTNKELEGVAQADVMYQWAEVGSDLIFERDLGLSWPKEVYSLSHVALPFPEDDPLYGSGRSSGQFTLGNLALYGEQGILGLSAADLLRQRWNPFYDFLEAETLRFLDLEGAPEIGSEAEVE